MKLVYKEKYLKRIIKALFNVLPFRYIVIMVDGGIASQINKLTIGFYFADKYKDKVKILYDTDWYRNCGMDIDGVNARKYEINKMYPDIRIRETGKFIKFITKCIYRHTTGWPDTYESVDDILLDHMYIDGYGYKIPLETRKYIFEKYLYKRVDTAVLNQDNLNILSQIRHSRNSIGVHVRRGDMARNSAIYDITPKNYFIKVMSDPKFSDSTFFVFSDDIKWVKEELVPFIQNRNIIVVDINGIDNGYSDLYLCSECNIIVSSQGSMAKFAAMLSNNENTILICPRNNGEDGDDVYWGQILYY